MVSGCIRDEPDSQDCNHGIPHEIMKGTLFHEYIRLWTC